MSFTPRARSAVTKSWSRSAKHLAAHDARVHGDIDDRDREDAVDHAAPEHRDDEDREQQRRERQQHVHASHQQVVEPAAVEARDQADERADDDGETDSGGAGEQRDAGPVDDAAELVTPVLVEPHEVLVLLLGAVEDVQARLLLHLAVLRDEQHLVRPRTARSAGASTAMPMMSVASTSPIRPDHERSTWRPTSPQRLDGWACAAGARCSRRPHRDRMVRTSIAPHAAVRPRHPCVTSTRTRGIEHGVQDVGDQVDERRRRRRRSARSPAPRRSRAP